MHAFRRFMMNVARYFAAVAITLLLAVPAAQAAEPSDAQIAEIVLRANQVDVNAGKLASGQAMSPEVRAFARKMVTVHGGIARAASALVRKLGIDPEPSVTSHSLEVGGAANVRKLRALKGAEFDRAYVGHEVAYHQHVIDALDQILIPNAHDAQLKALLVSARPTFVAHLEHARHIQDTLGR
jgi:putative membrane protein